MRDPDSKKEESRAKELEAKDALSIRLILEEAPQPDLDRGVEHHCLKEEDQEKEEDSPEFKEKSWLNQREKGVKEP